MERIYVSTKAIRQGSVELASLNKKEERRKEKIQFLPSSGFGCRRYMHTGREDSDGES